MENTTKKNNKRKLVSLKIVKENYAWIIAVVTSLGILGVNIFRFIEFVIAFLYFDFYDLNLNLYKYTDQGIIYILLIIFLLGLLFYRILFLINECFKHFEFNIGYLKAYSFELFEIIIFNSIAAGSYGLKNGALGFIVFFLFLIVLEIIGSLLFFRNQDFTMLKKMNLKYLVLAIVRVLPMFFCYIILSTIILLSLALNNIKEYRIIDDNKAIIYSNSEYYLTLDCKIEDDKLIIYKGKQNKIDTDSVSSELIKFEKVEIKQE